MSSPTKVLIALYAPPFPRTNKHTLRYTSFTCHVVSCLYRYCLVVIFLSCPHYRTTSANESIATPPGNKPRILCDLRFLSQYRCLHSSGMLRSVDWSLVTHVSGQLSSPSSRISFLGLLDPCSWDR